MKKRYTVLLQPADPEAIERQIHLVTDRSVGDHVDIIRQYLPVDTSCTEYTFEADENHSISLMYFDKFEDEGVKFSNKLEINGQYPLALPVLVRSDYVSE